MSKLRLIFLVFFILLLTPFVKFFDLNQDKERFILAGKGRAYVEDIKNHPRKKILDRNNNELAVSILRSTLLFRSEEEKDLGIRFSEISNEPIFLTNPKRIYFENEIDKKFINDLKSFCKCVAISEPIYRRYYPHGGIVSPLIGFSGVGGGLEGIERSYDSILSSDVENINFFRDGKGRRVKGDIKDFIENRLKDDLRLTIDINIQYKVFQELKQAISDAKAKGGYAVLMNSRNGDILAIASYPTFNPNRNDRVVQRNLSLDEYLEPGSLIKPLTIAGAIKRGIISKDSIIDTNPGYVNLSGFKRSEAGGKNFGELNPAEIIINSSQVGIAKIAIQQSEDDIYSNLRNFGIGRSLDLNWYGIDSSYLYDNQKLYDIDKASLGYGYLIRANIVQLARAYSVFANKGKMVEPKITFDAKTNALDVISEDTAEYILNALRSTVINGTADSISNSSVNIAGKTGTTEKYIVGTGYAPGKYISSFASIFPYEDPEFVMVVSIDEPNPNNYFGGEISAPIVAKVAEYMQSNGYIE